MRWPRSVAEATYSTHMTKKQKIILNFQKKQYQWDISYHDWLYSNNPTGQHLQIRTNQDYLGKYLALCCFRTKDTPNPLMFYLNLLYRVKQFMNQEHCKRIQPTWTAELPYSVIFNRFLPRSKVVEKAKELGITCDFDLFGEQAKNIAECKAMKFKLCKAVVAPYLDLLQKAGLITWSTKRKSDGTEAAQFFVKIDTSIDVDLDKSYDVDKTLHRNFLAIPYCMMFDADKITSLQMMSFILFFASKSSVTKSQDGESLADFTAIAKKNNIGELFASASPKFKQCCAQNKLDTNAAVGYTLSEEFLKLMNSEFMRQEAGCLILDQAPSQNIKDNSTSKFIINKLDEKLDERREVSDDYIRVSDALFYNIQEFKQRATIYRAKDGSVCLVYNARDGVPDYHIKYVKDVFAKYKTIIDDALLSVLRRHFNINYAPILLLVDS